MIIISTNKGVFMKLKDKEILIDFLNIKNLKIIQRSDYFNFSLDTVLLANFLTINRTTKKILDLGTGNGSIPLLLSQRSKAHITGIEIQEISADLAKRNVTINNLDHQIEIINKDMKDIFEVLTTSSFDAVISNPPFFKLDGNPDQINNLDQLSLARHEISITLEEIIEIGSKMLRNRGYFAMVHRADRLADILNLYQKYKIGVKRIQFCHSKLNKEAKIILVEGLKDSDSTLKILPPMITHNETGKYSDKIMKMFDGSFRY